MSGWNLSEANYSVCHVHQNYNELSVSASQAMGCLCLLHLFRGHHCMIRCKFLPAQTSGHQL